MLRITLLKYISKEIWSIFLTCLIVFVFIFIASFMLNMSELMVNYGVSLGEVLSMMLCIIPRGILTVMPAACLMAVLLSFIRMASDNEIIALHSSGISLYQLMPPVIFFSIICFLFAAFMSLFATPYGNRTREELLANIMKTRIDSQLKERVFLELGDVVFYVNNYSPKDKIMKDVFVVDKRDGKERTIVAKKARFIPGKNIIQFMDCKVFTEGKGGESVVWDFPDSFDINLGKYIKPGSSGNDEIEPYAMYFGELLKLINNSKDDIKIKNIAKLKLYEMFSLPLAVLIITLIGAPLGAQIRAKGRTKGIIISLFLFLSYYIILTSVRYLCENGIIIPDIGAWLPALFLLIICIFLLVRSAGNLSFGILNRFILSS